MLKEPQRYSRRYSFSYKIHQPCDSFPSSKRKMSMLNFMGYSSTKVPSLSCTVWNYMWWDFGRKTSLTFWDIVKYDCRSTEYWRHYDNLTISPGRSNVGRWFQLQKAHIELPNHLKGSCKPISYHSISKDKQNYILLMHFVSEYRWCPRLEVKW